MSDDSAHDDEGSGHEADAGDGVGAIAGGTAGALEGVADVVDDEEAEHALEAAAGAAEAVEDGTKAASEIAEGIEGVASGDVGDAAGGLLGGAGALGEGVGALTGGIADALGEDAHEAAEALETVSEVAETVGAVAEGVAGIIEGGEELLDALLGARHDVHYHFEIDGEETRFTVREVQIEEGLSELGECKVRVTFSQSAHLDEKELLGKDAHVSIERGEEMRHYRGVLRYVSVRPGDDHQVLVAELVPALWMASQTRDSRIYQDKTVVEVVEEIVEELFGDRHRSVRQELTEDYPTHEYLVQHRESHYEFIERLLREEGIFHFFDHDAEDEDHEVLVLADSNDNRPTVREEHDGVVEFELNERTARGREVATEVERHLRVGATDAVIAGFDWSNPRLEVQDEQTERHEWHGARLEVFDHDRAVRHTEYDEGQGSYKAHTAARHGKLRAERLDLERQHHRVKATVVSAAPGKVFELQGAAQYDGRYLIVSLEAEGGADHAASHGGDYEATMVVIPLAFAYRPPHPERRVMPGPETATVVGPSGEEIHTDKHGRVKVQFHWDRRGARDEHSSAWIRVAQGWAGNGFGSMFIPRIKMEVVVSFLGGDPDRPVITGCLYNGANTPPLDLPADKTRSTIKTSSSLGGGGFNELRFEDDAGSEEVYIHAEKDFNEVVENNHSTHVKVDQTNTVDNDQTETVGNDQKMTVENDRTKVVEGNETTTVKKDRKETVEQNEAVKIQVDRSHTVEGNDALLVHGERSHTVLSGEEVVVAQGQKVNVTGDRETSIVNNDKLEVAVNYDVEVGAHVLINQGGAASVLLENKIEGDTTGDIKFTTPGAQVEMTASGLVQVTAMTKLVLECGDSRVEVTPSGISIVGPQVTVNSTSGNTKVDASGQVQIKC